MLYWVCLFYCRTLTEDIHAYDKTLNQSAVSTKETAKISTRIKRSLDALFSLTFAELNAVQDRLVRSDGLILRNETKRRIKLKYLYVSLLYCDWERNR